MTSRDRMVLIVVVVAAVMGAAWVLVVSPERKQADQLSGQVAAARTALASAEGEVQHVRTAQARYLTAYTSLVSLGKAMPASAEVPGLIYAVAQASGNKHVTFSSVVVGTGAPAAGTAAGKSGASSSPSSSASASTAPALTPVTFTFGFQGNFFALEKLLGELSGLTQRASAGVIRVNGRLLTISGVRLAPAASEGGHASSGQLGGSITATAYVMPPVGPAAAGGSATAAPATPAAASATPSSPTTPAIVRVTP